MDTVLIALQQLCNNIEFSLVSKMSLLNKKLIKKLVIAKGDSGSSKHYTRPEDTYILTGLILYKVQPIVSPNNASITPSHAGG